MGILTNCCGKVVIFEKINSKTKFSKKKPVFKNNSKHRPLQKNISKNRPVTRHVSTGHKRDADGGGDF